MEKLMRCECLPPPKELDTDNKGRLIVKKLLPMGTNGKKNNYPERNRRSDSIYFQTRQLLQLLMPINGPADQEAVMKYFVFKNLQQVLYGKDY